MFPTTHWSEILSLRDRPEQRRSLLSEIAARTWRPLYLHARLKGLSRDAAEDAVQGLFARLYEREFERALDPARGRLRCYLRAALDHHISDQRARDRACKRGGDAHAISLDVVSADQALTADRRTDPDAAFDRQWALQLMQRALARLRAEYRSGQRSGPLELIELHFSGDPTPCAQLAKRFGMTIPQVKSFLHRARGRFRTLVRLEVSATVTTADQVGDELTVVEAALFD
jgi:RNA polymerase sigma-70 factor (ECF subfamily)